MLAAGVVALAVAVLPFVWQRRRFAEHRAQLTAECERLRALASEQAASLQALPELLFEVDGTGRFLALWSDADAALPAAEKVIGRVLEEVLPADAATGIRQALVAAGELGLARGQLITLPLASGPCPFELAVRCRETADGAGRFVVFARNVTAGVVLEPDQADSRAETRGLLAEAEQSRLILLSILEDQKHTAEELLQYRQHLEELVSRRTAELAAAKDAAEIANRAKSLFLANMSHEIRTPMNAIVGQTHMLQRSMLEADQQERLSRIRESADHLLVLINDVLDLSKVEAGKVRLEEIAFSLLPLLQKIGATVRERTEAKGLALRLELPAEVDINLVGDPTRLSQALLNYLSNAVKFTERGAVALRCERLADDGEQVTLRFEVADTGIGIDADTLGRLFNAFEQADNSITRQFGGTGLGLAITRHLARLMGGEAGVSSEPGVGSTFWFTARFRHGRGRPAVEPAALPGTDAEGALRTVCAGRHILICEDNRVNQEVARDLLEAVGLQVTVAENGEEGLLCLERASFDLVLMDMQMPVLDGLGATRRIRARSEWRDLPVIAMTANAFAEDRQACLAAGMNDFVAKPVEPSVLYGCLNRWLRGTPQPVAGGPSPDSASPGGGPATAMSLDVAGLNTVAALAITRGNRQRLIRLLRIFRDGHADDLPKLRTLLEAGDMAAAGQLVHALKGASGTICLTTIYQHAAALNDRIRAGAGAAEIIAGLAPLGEALEAACTAIGELPSE